MILLGASASLTATDTGMMRGPRGALIAARPRVPSIRMICYLCPTPYSVRREVFMLYIYFHKTILYEARCLPVGVKNQESARRG